MKAFLGLQDVKDRAIQRAVKGRENGQFYGWGHYYHEGKGNVSGVMYHPYLEDGQVEQDVKMYPEPVHGIPYAVAGIIDDFFSGLCCHDDKDLHQHWAERVYTAIPVGADLSRLPDRLAVYMLENTEWLADYACDRGGPLVGFMYAIFLLRLEGIDQTKRMKNFYYDHIHKLHRHQMNGRNKNENYVMAALSAICGVDTNTNGAWHYFISHACHGSAVHKRTKYANRVADLSDIFIQMIKDCA